jgi:hypothetical protein
MFREKKARNGSSEAPPTKCIALHVSVKEIIPNLKLILMSLFFLLSQKHVYLPVLWIRIGFNADPNPDPGFFYKKLLKFTVLKQLYFLIKNCNLLIPRPL